MAIKTVLPIRAATLSPLAASAMSREFPEFASFSKAILLLEVTAVNGTNPTLDITMQEYDPQANEWNNLPAPQLTQVTGVSSQRILLVDFGTNLRANYVIGGTDSPDFEFTLTAIVTS